MSEKISVFRSPEGEAKSMAAYEVVLALWPVPYEECTYQPGWALPISLPVVP